MSTRSSSTVAATSEIAQLVSRALQVAAETISEDRADHIARLQERIRDLESRGFIKRQVFSAPATGQFERWAAYIKKS